MATPYNEALTREALYQEILEVKEQVKRLREANTTVLELDKQVNAHEKVCASRYETIMEKFEDMKERFSKMETVAYSIAVTVFLGMAAIIGKAYNLV